MNDPAWKPNFDTGDEGEEFVKSTEFMQRVLGQSFSPFLKRRHVRMKLSSESAARVMESQFPRMVAGHYQPSAAGLYLPSAASLVDDRAASTAAPPSRFAPASLEDMIKVMDSTLKESGPRITQIIESDMFTETVFEWVRVKRSLRERVMGGRRPAQLALRLALTVALASVAIGAWPVAVAVTALSVLPRLNRPLVPQRPAKIARKEPYPGIYLIAQGDGTHVLAGHPSVIARVREACAAEGLDLDGILQRRYL